MTETQDLTDKGIPVYRVVKWDDRYENNRTRGMKEMQWIPVKNSHDGDGYTFIMDLKDGPSIYGAWMVILQVASKCDPRGTLLRSNGTPHAPKSIGRLSRCPEAIIARAVEVLCSDDVAWLEVAEYQRLAGGCGESAGKVPKTDEEGNGIEGNGIEGKEGNIVGGAAVPAPSPVVCVFPLARIGDEFSVTQEMIDEWQESFPGVNIASEIKVCLQWNRDNPKKRKTYSGIKKHISGWMARKQDKGGSNGIRPSAADQRRAEKASREYPEEIHVKSL